CGSGDSGVLADIRAPGPCADLRSRAGLGRFPAAFRLRRERRLGSAGVLCDAAGYDVVPAVAFWSVAEDQALILLRFAADTRPRRKRSERFCYMSMMCSPKTAFPVVLLMALAAGCSSVGRFDATPSHSVDMSG